MSAQVLLRAQHLRLSFGSLTAIDDLSFTLRKNEITGLVGPEGAGKTSVMDCLSGLRHPASGRIELYNSARPLLLERMEPFRIVRNAGVVRTFRDPRLFRRMTVLENVLLAEFAARSIIWPVGNLVPYRWNRKAVERARYWLDRMGLSHAQGRKAGELTAPMQRRLEIARAAALTPKLLCMDEPDIGLTRRECDQLATHLLELRQSGIAVLLTGQDTRLAESLCDHVVVLDRGACVAAGKPVDVCGRPAVQRAWLGVPAGHDLVPRIFVSC
ncbi:MAG TPA: ATP-binding cassette domain-containing protein [Micropepsaceae bacterium]|nr:ATP-binding cassette domain-containing protein [Micropepsaceae bacterium]